MKLNSHKELIEIVRVLTSLGYSTPFCDYEYDMKLHGFNKHIHLYECKVGHTIVDKEDMHKDLVFIFFFDNSNNNIYQIQLERKELCHQKNQLENQ